MVDVTLVTGGAGFIGSNIVNKLAETGRNIVICDWFRHEEAWRYISPWAIHDAISPDHLPEWLGRNESSIEAIVHMGAISATTARDLELIVKSNVRMTLDLWTFAALFNKPFVYASSAATYGDGSQGFKEPDSLEELYRVRPLNAYAWSKQVVDCRIAADAASGAPQPPLWAGLRFFNVYGPHEDHKGDMRSVIHKIYPLAARGCTVQLFKSYRAGYEDGGQRRDFVYVEDCARVVVNVLESNSVQGIYNVGTGKSRTFAELASCVFDAVGREPAIEYVDMPETLREKYQYCTEADLSRLEADRLAPRFLTLEEGITRYVETYLRHTSVLQ